MLLIVIIGVFELASLSSLASWLAKAGAGVGRTSDAGGLTVEGPPPGDGVAWTIGASAKATTNNTAVTLLFRFFMLLIFFHCFGLP
jgi:hypothetical protein